MKDITNNDASAESSVILKSEWSQHALQQRRLQWVALGQVFGEQMDDYFSRKTAIAAGAEAEVDEELECLA